ncbi:MAG: ABC transporter ATP-binding protein [Culicoidibacterales bacterium]
MMIQCRDIHKAFPIGKETVEILRGINLDVAKGEFVAIVGESGSGKSTFLNVLSGIMPTDQGEMIIADAHLEQMNENALALFRRGHLGFIFQSYNLLPQLSAIENVEMPLIFAGVPKAERRQQAKTMLSKVGLSERFDHLPSELSGGQQQRVAIARALVNNPQVILADEPTGNLDSKTSIEILDLLKQLNRDEGMTFVVVTHSHVVYEYADRLIEMKDGLLVKEEQKGEK